MRNLGEWIREKDHLCPCFTKPEDGPRQYDMGETYFCFARIKNPFARNFAARYVTMLQPFCADPGQELKILADLHKDERRVGSCFRGSQLIAKLTGLRQPPMDLDAMDAVRAWLEQNMIDEGDHRAFPAFKTQAEWSKAEGEFLKKYAPHRWAWIGHTAPTKWHNIQAYAHAMEMFHRTDIAFVTNRPRVQRRRNNEAAVTQVESMERERKDIDG